MLNFTYRSDIQITYVRALRTCDVEEQSVRQWIEWISYFSYPEVVSLPRSNRQVGYTHCVRWGPVPPKGHGPQLSDHVCCGQTTAGWIKMPLVGEVGLSPINIVLDGDPALPNERAQQPPLFGPCLLWPNISLFTKKGTGFPYSIPSVGHGADPGVQAVMLQVTVKSSTRR